MELFLKRKGSFPVSRLKGHYIFDQLCGYMPIAGQTERGVARRLALLIYTSCESMSITDIIAVPDCEYIRAEDGGMYSVVKRKGFSKRLKSI